MTDGQGEGADKSHKQSVNERRGDADLVNDDYDTEFPDGYSRHACNKIWITESGLSCRATYKTCERIRCKACNTLNALVAISSPR